MRGRRDSQYSHDYRGAFQGTVINVFISSKPGKPTRFLFQVPEDQSEWDTPEYFFPTYENDNLLHYLEEVGTGSSAAGKGSVGNAAGNTAEVPVYAEEFEIGDSVLLDQQYRESICPPVNNKPKRGYQKRGGKK